MADLLYRLTFAAAKTWFTLGKVEIDLQGTEHIPTSGGAVLAVNHNSHLDFIAAGYPGERRGRFTRFMAKREVFDHPVGGPVMRGFKHLSVDRSQGAEALRVATAACRSGEVVGIYPEATISRSFQIKELKSGAVRIAADAGVPLIPVTHFGMHRIQTKGHPRDFSRGKPVVMRVGEPMYPTGEDLVAETAELHRRLSDLLDECVRAFPLQEPDAWWLPETHGGSAPSLEEAERIDREEKRERARRKAAKRR
ncbi:lysophospholipid acyltransferase family protein [Nocardioides insulae]|uniref:lysophospholipid acyltransferase family protein n=1 Tax=Nocardioides insulae TaxID=394734 RepID=UPI00042845D4|nr:lysophospholipid acyltransferase family protein [Nocardioides insulae]